MTANYMRAGKGSEFVATARLLTVTSAAAVLGAEPTDEREGRIASVSVVVQLVKDTTEQR
jgi:acyl-coenzyme A thioesterase PaaI-like protein